MYGSVFVRCYYCNRLIAAYEGSPIQHTDKWGTTRRLGFCCTACREGATCGQRRPINFTGEIKMKLTKKELDELFVYDETSSTCLRWKDGNEYGTTGEAGRHDVRGTPFLFIYGQRVSVALIIWVMHGRTLHPQKALAPRDGNLANVRIGNLQEVTLYQTPL